MEVQRLLLVVVQHLAQFLLVAVVLEAVGHQEMEHRAVRAVEVPGITPQMELVVLEIPADTPRQKVIQEEPLSIILIIKAVAVEVLTLLVQMLQATMLVLVEQEKHLLSPVLL